MAALGILSCRRSTDHRRIRGPVRPDGRGPVLRQKPARRLWPDCFPPDRKLGRGSFHLRISGSRNQQLGARRRHGFRRALLGASGIPGKIRSEHAASLAAGIQVLAIAGVLLWAVLLWAVLSGYYIRVYG